ncbi:MAG: hypothetical protein IBJ10_05575 [Phycisphaerales bacterium]|nr:hypothetical protein [Phycisphaerales bacterium]
MISAPSLADLPSTHAVPRSSVAQSLDPRGFESAAAGAKERPSPESLARQAAADLVSIALVQPTLKMLRESNMAAAPFAPGDSEKTFGAFLDAEYASRITSASRFGLVDAIAGRMLANAAGREVDVRG